MTANTPPPSVGLMQLCLIMPPLKELVEVNQMFVERKTTRPQLPQKGF